MIDVPDWSEIKLSLECAKATFLEREAYLLRVDANERAITHKFAEHLQPLFADWNVDCEYNRDGDTPKELRAMSAERAPKSDTDARTVFPDIIIHKRGPAGPHLVVIEAKKHGRNTAEDEEKLLGYRWHLGYQHTVLLIFHTGAHPSIDIRPI